jgi:hypothetical protein
MFVYWSRLHRKPRADLPSGDHTEAKFLTDLYPPWTAARELLLNHRDPYGSQVTREIQVAYFGRELNDTRYSDLSDAQRFSLAYRFAYPVYTVLYMAPLMSMQFHTARIVFWWFLESIALLSVYLWLRFVRVQLSWAGTVILLAIFMSSIPVMQGLRILQLGLLVATLIAATALCAAHGRLFLAGVFLALATIRPQMSFLAISWFFLWLSAAWAQRRALLWGFAATLAGLLLISEYLLPGWLLRYPAVLGLYAKYTGAASLLQLLMPSTLYWLVITAALYVVVPFCWRARRQPADSAPFALALAFMMILTVSIVPTVVASFNQVLLLPAVLLVISYWSKLQQLTRPSRIACQALGVLIFLPWLLAVCATAARFVRHDSVSKIAFAPLTASIALPFAIFGLLVILRTQFAITSAPRLLVENGTPETPRIVGQ